MRVAWEGALKGDDVTIPRGGWERLTAVDQSYLFGYWNAHCDAHREWLTPMYEMRDGTFLSPKEVVDRGRSAEVHHSDYHFCYVETEVNTGEKVYTPW
jgi:hypothetical protein